MQVNKAFSEVGEGARPSPSSSEAVAALGAKIQRFRQARRMSLRELATLAETSPSFISQLERGLTGASTGTLMRIAQGLGIRIADLFEDEGGAVHQVLRRRNRPALPAHDRYLKTLLTRRPIREFEAYGGELEVGGSTGDKPYVHGDSQEMLLVLRGSVELRLGEKTHVLDEGDCIEYRSSTPHGLRNIGSSRAEVVWIFSPPTMADAHHKLYVAPE